MMPTGRWLAAMAEPLDDDSSAETDDDRALPDADWGDAPSPELLGGPTRIAHIISATDGLYRLEDDSEDLDNDIAYPVLATGIYIMRLMHIKDWGLGLIRAFLQHVGLASRWKEEVKAKAEDMQGTRACKRRYSEVVHAGRTVGRVLPHEPFRLILDYLQYPRGYSDVVHAGLTVERVLPHVPCMVILDFLQYPRCRLTLWRRDDRSRGRAHAKAMV